MSCSVTLHFGSIRWLVHWWLPEPFLIGMLFTCTVASRLARMSMVLSCACSLPCSTFERCLSSWLPPATIKVTLGTGAHVNILTGFPVIFAKVHFAVADRSPRRTGLIEGCLADGNDRDHQCLEFDDFEVCCDRNGVRGVPSSSQRSLACRSPGLLAVRIRRLRGWCFGRCVSQFLPAREHGQVRHCLH